jgi:hypothetical protein
MSLLPGASHRAMTRSDYSLSTLERTTGRDGY